MKKTIFIVAFALCAAAFSACSGNSNEEPVPADALTLTPSKKTLTANGTDKVTFTVIKPDLTTVMPDIFLTAVDGVKQETKLASTEFTTLKNGAYTFEARYNNLVSNSVIITATGEQKQDEKYYRNVCVMKLTGTWCSFCPTAGRQVDVLASGKYPDRLIQMAFHGGKSDEPMLIPETKTINDAFNVGNSFPATVTDLRRSTATSTNIYGKTDASIAQSLADHAATCGVRINSVVSGKTLSITAGVTSNTGGTYRVGVYIIENGLVYTQLDGSLYNENFEHNHVTRKMLSKTIYGDTLGALAANVEKTKEYTVEIAEGWTLANLKVVVYVVNEADEINNIAECAANNGSVAYRLNKANN